MGRREAHWELISGQMLSSSSLFLPATTQPSMAVLRGESSGLLHALERATSTATHSNTYATARSMRAISSIRRCPLSAAINLEGRPGDRFGGTVPSSSVTTRGYGNRKVLPRSRPFPQRQLEPAISRQGTSRDRKSVV